MKNIYFVHLCDLSTPAFSFELDTKNSYGFYELTDARKIEQLSTGSDQEVLISGLLDQKKKTSALTELTFIPIIVYSEIIRLPSCYSLSFIKCRITIHSDWI